MTFRMPPCFTTGLVDPANLVAHILPLSTERLADVDHHVDLVASGPRRVLGLQHFDGGAAVAVWEADDRTDAHSAAGKDLLRHGGSRRVSRRR